MKRKFDPRIMLIISMVTFGVMFLLSSVFEILSYETVFALWPVILIAGIHHVFARAIGALAGVAFPGSGGNGMLASFREGAAKRATWILLVWCLICAAALIVLSPISGLFCTLAAVVLLLGLRVMSLKEFGGMSGDLAGYLITLSELVLLACFIFAEKVVLVCF